MHAPHLLATALLACTLAVPLAHAGPKTRAPQPTQYLTHAEQVCRDFGIFAYNKAAERDRGASMTDILMASRQRDQENGADGDVRTIHDFIIRKLHTPPFSAPAKERQAFEAWCLSLKTDTQPQTQTPTYNPRLRY
jgi:hypothetical protein